MIHDPAYGLRSFETKLHSPEPPIGHIKELRCVWRDRAGLQVITGKRSGMQNMPRSAESALNLAFCFVQDHGCPAPGAVQVYFKIRGIHFFIIF
jgi:hypothetical protein